MLGTVGIAQRQCEKFSMVLNYCKLNIQSLYIWNTENTLHSRLNYAFQAKTGLNDNLKSAEWTFKLTVEGCLLDDISFE